MTEFKGLELVDMEKTRLGINQIQNTKLRLKPKLSWFLNEDFKELRDGFKPTNNQRILKTKK